MFDELGSWRSILLGFVFIAIGLGLLALWKPAGAVVLLCAGLFNAVNIFMLGGYRD